jgi:hypothetical protein
MPSLDMMVPHMENVYMVNEDDPIPIDDEEVAHMEAPNTSTPTSHE